MRNAMIALTALLLATSSAAATPPAERPPAPPIDLGDWDKPSKPIWMETELQSQAGKVKPVNLNDCAGDLMASTLRTKVCQASIAIVYDVTSGGLAANLRVIESTPAGALDAAATEAVQCFRFPLAADGADPASRTGVIFRFSVESCTTPQ